MSVLKNLESKIAGLVEGTFSRAFRSEVRPVEIARKLAREMDEHRSPSLSRTYVPNEYAVCLSPPDRERFADYEDALQTELSGYLLEHARGERFSLLSRPVIEFRTDERLRSGEFGIQARLVACRGAGRPGAARRQGDAGHTMVYSAAERLAEPLEERARSARELGRARPRGQAHRRSARAAPSLGRSRDCEIMLADANVSRHHAEIRPRGGGWVLTDLGSTNGVSVNGVPVDRPTRALARRRDRARHDPRHLRPRRSNPMLDPVSVALKFGFLLVLYLFLLWVARSALKDLRRSRPRGAGRRARSRRPPTRPACTRPSAGLGVERRRATRTSSSSAPPATKRA